MDNEEEQFNENNDAQEVIEDFDGPEMVSDDSMSVDGNNQDDDELDQQEPFHFEDDSIQGFFDHKEPVYSIALHPTLPHLVVSGGGDDTAYLWRKDNGMLVSVLKKHEDSVSAVAFSSDGQYVASGGMDGKIHVFKGVSGQYVVSVEGPSEVIWLRWHPNGPILLCGSADGTLWMWNIPSGACMNVFTAHSDSVHTGRFTNSGKNIVSGSEDGSVIIWDPRTAAAITRFPSTAAPKFHEGPIYAVDIHQDDQTILTGSEDGFARLVHITTGKTLAQFDHQENSVEAVAICMNQNPSLCATGDISGAIHIWDLNTYRLRATLKHDDAITKLVFHSESFTLFSASADKTVRAWNTKTGECLKVWHGHQEPILDFAVSKDGQQVVTAGDDGVCLVFSF